MTLDGDDTKSKVIRFDEIHNFHATHFSFEFILKKGFVQAKIWCQL